MSTASSPHIKIFAVEGTFDDCQNLVKELFRDQALRTEVNLAGVNSINWARILAQIVYFFSAYYQLKDHKGSISFSVPTGNFGDAYAGYVAKRMGLPINRILIATNKNDILNRLLIEKSYLKGQVQKSLSPSMDIQIASNFERLLFEVLNRSSKKLVQLMELLENENGFFLTEEVGQKLNKDFSSGSASDKDTLATINKYYRKKNILLCPHSAIGVKVAEENRNSEEVMVSLATAHPGKFKETVEKAIGEEIDLPHALAKVLRKKEQYQIVPLDKDIIASEIRRSFSK
jgi:threonine synthase